VKSELDNASEGYDAGDKPTITLWTRVTKFIKKNIIFSAPKFVEELNEAVTYLALYVGIFSASFSTTYTTVALQLLVNDQKDKLKDLQTRVFGDNKFISMVEGAFVYPLLQSKKTYDTCMLKTDANNSKCDAIFNTTAENVRNGMMKSFNQKENVVTGELFNKMTKLKAVVDNNTAEITNATDATTFADAVKDAFNADKSSTTPSSTTSNETSATSNATPSNTTPSNDVQSVVQNATQSSVTQSSVKPSPNALSATQSSVSSATPSATNATIPSETSVKNAIITTPNGMPVMQQNQNNHTAAAGGG
jgi:hypothetical protein